MFSTNNSVVGVEFFLNLFFIIGYSYYFFNFQYFLKFRSKLGTCYEDVRADNASTPEAAPAPAPWPKRKHAKAKKADAPLHLVLISQPSVCDQMSHPRAMRLLPKTHPWAHLLTELPHCISCPISLTWSLRSAMWSSRMMPWKPSMNMIEEWMLGWENLRREVDL